VAYRIQADVVVLGAHREHRSRTHGIGGTALAVATDSSCPVLVASTPLNLPLSRVLVPVDLSDTARGALLVGLSWASGLRPPAHEGSDQHDVTLTALHIAPVSGAMPPALTRELDAVRQAGGNWAGVSTREETIASTDAANGIATYAGSNGAELIVMGTRGLGLDAVGRLGSVAATVTRIIHVPVLLVPPAIWMGYVAQPRPD
jgi:nucleotide-binding universal stress UspA family protein